MTNAFTQKPDLGKFVKEVRHSHFASTTGTKQVQNPTYEQAHFLAIKDKEKTMTKTVVRGNWPAAEVVEIKHVEKPKPVAKPKVQPLPSNSGMKVVQVPYTFRPQVNGVSMYQKEIDALLSSQYGQVAVECKTNDKAKRLVAALQRQINRAGNKEKLRAVTKQMDNGVTFVWVIERAQAQ